MKKLCFALLGLMVLFGACKKDAKDKPEESIIGTWTGKEIAYEYYDETGKLVDTDKDTYPTTWTFTDKQLIIKSDDNGDETYNYTIAKSKDKTLLLLDDAVNFEVKVLNRNELVLYLEDTDANGKEITTYSLTR